MRAYTCRAAAQFRKKVRLSEPCNTQSFEFTNTNAPKKIKKKKKNPRGIEPLDLIDQTLHLAWDWRLLRRDWFS